MIYVLLVCISTGCYSFEFDNKMSCLMGIQYLMMTHNIPRDQMECMRQG